MVNWLSSFLLLSEAEGIRINTDILETNLINIIILLVLLVYVLGTFLNENLSSRLEQIISSIQEGEKQLNAANERLAEAQALWDQREMGLELIKERTKRNQVRIVDAEVERIEEDLALSTQKTKGLLRYQEKKISNEIMKRISGVVLNQAGLKALTLLKETDQSLIIDSKINRLGGSL